MKNLFYYFVKMKFHTAYTVYRENYQTLLFTVFVHSLCIHVQNYKNTFELVFFPTIIEMKISKQGMKGLRALPMHAILQLYP